MSKEKYILPYLPYPKHRYRDGSTTDFGNYCISGSVKLFCKPDLKRKQIK